MNLVQAAYDILVTLSIIDGEFDESEGQVILEFLDDNYDGTFDPQAENAVLMGLDDAGVMARFDQARELFGANATAEDKEALLEFGLDMVMTDGTLAEEENRLMRKLSEAWGVPLQPLVVRAMDIT